jgi:transposase
MKKHNHGQVIYKPYQQGQMNMPLDISDMIPDKHIVRVVNQAIDEMDISGIEKQYKGGGTSSYHPCMMLKVLIYAYTQRTFTSRQIAKALRENMYYMWLSGGNRPDFRTINRFRSEIVRKTMDELFTMVLDYLNRGGYIKLEKYFLDGTKIGANANRYSYVWKKNTQRYKKALKEKVKGLLDEIEVANEAENREYGDHDLEEMGETAEVDVEGLKEVVEKLNKKLKELEQEGSKDEKKEDKKRVKKQVNQLQETFLKLKKYEEQEKILGGRNSYSKTDHDATFMRMKEDHLPNSQTKPGYNVQIGTENQFVLGFSIHDNPSDSVTLIPHLKQAYEKMLKKPIQVIADAGYGSEENYAYLEKEGIEAYVKYNYFDDEQRKGGSKSQRYRTKNWPYDPEKDIFICPEGKPLHNERTYFRTTQNGYVTEVRMYRCQDCNQCPVVELCNKSKIGRTISVRPRMEGYRQSARERLTSETGLKLRSQRSTEAETVFGQIKHNWGFRKFLCRGKEKVKTEWGLLCIAHNLTKMATY